MAWPLAYNIDGAVLTAARPQIAQKPTIMLVHDAFLTLSHMAPLHAALTELGYRVYSPQLPSTGYSYQTDAMALDVSTLDTTARPELRSGRNMVVVASGYGAVPATLTAERLNQWSLETPRAGRIIRFIYIAGMLLQEGERVGSALTLSPGSLEIGQDRMIRLKTAAARNLFSPCSDSVQASGVSAVQYLNSTVLVTPNPTEAWSSIPGIYLVCELDNNLKPSAQEEFAARLQEENPHSRILRGQFGHAPFFTHAPAIAQIIHRLSAGANT